MVTLPDGLAFALVAAAVGLAIAYAVAPRSPPLVGALLAGVGAAGMGLVATALDLRHAFAAAGGVPPSERAAALAAGIASAYRATAVGLGAVPVWATALVIGAVRRRRQRP